MKQILPAFLLFLSVSLFAQNTWQSAAKKYLADQQLYGTYFMDEGIMFDEYIDPLITKMVEEFESGNKNEYLLHLLSVLDPQKNINGHEEHLEAALRAYSKNSVNQALLLLELSSITHFIDTPLDYKDLLNRASENLQSQKNQDWKLNIYLLKESALLYDVDDLDDARAEPIAQLKEAIRLCELHLGSENMLYGELLEDLSYQYSWIGEIELATKYEEKANLSNASISGANQLNKKLYDYEDPELTDKGLSESQNSLFLLAQLFESTSGSFYSKRMALQLYDALFKSFKTSQVRLMADFAINIGLRHLELENFAQAASYFQAANTNYDKIETNDISLKIHHYNSVMQLGVAYYENGNFREAFDIFSKIFELNISYINKVVVHNLILTSDKLKDRENVKKYIEAFLKLNDSVDDENPEIFRKYGQINVAAGHHDQAYNLFKRAYDEYWSLAAFRQMDEDELEDSDFEMGNIEFEDMVLEIGATSADFTLYEGQKLPIEEGYQPLLSDLALSAYRTGRYKEAAFYVGGFINEYYTEVQVKREEASMSGFQYGSDLSDIYRLKQTLFPKYELFHNIILKDQHATEEQRSENLQLAYNRILDSKSNIQFELRHMRKTIAESSDSTLKATYNLYQKYREELSENVLEKTEDQANVKVKLNNLRLELSAMSAAFKPVDKQFTFWTDVKSTLKKNEAAVEFNRVKGIDSDSIYYLAYIITPSSKHPEVVVFKNGNFMEDKAIVNYKNSIQFKLRDDRSFDTFWKPIIPHLKGVKKIFISPDGVYHQLNLNTLMNPETNEYVDEKTNIIQVINTKQLIKRTKKKGKIKRATLIGRPAYDLDDFQIDSILSGEESKERALSRAQITRGKIEDLPGTEVEVRNIEKVLLGQKIETELYLGARSSEENLKKAESNLLHIATHGFWFEEDGESNADAMFQSGLLFAGVKNLAQSATSNSNDGILTAYEIQGMSLEQTQVAVLSACETGLGKVAVGEGVYGLQRAFIIAGVDQLIMSLWKVDDDATQQLFSIFYKKWLTEGKTVSEAFKEAKKVLRKKYKEPYYWGAFVLID